jgi:hypothetical protein
MKDAGANIIEDVTMLVPREPYFWVLPAVVILIVCLLAAFAVWRLFRAKKLPFQHPAVPPGVTARERLAAIRHLIAEGKHERFVIAVSGVLRDYIEARFGLKAPTLSSEEFLFEAERSALLDAGWQEKLNLFLARCDRVKFALANLQTPKMEELYGTAESFINGTAPSPEPEAQVAQPSAA